MLKLILKGTTLKILYVLAVKPASVKSSLK